MTGRALFDQAAFSTSLRVRIAERNIDQRVAAAEIGCSPSSICRIYNGKAPTVETYLRIKQWLSAAPTRQPRSRP